MRLTIIKDDGVVGVDGEFFPVDLSTLPNDLHAVQWNDTTGHVEMKNLPNTTISDISSYQPIIDAWQLQKDDMVARQDPYYGMTDQEKADKILQEQKDDIARQRYEMESSGITYEGLTVSTDRESVQILDSTCDKIRRGLISSVEWKCKEGYLTLTSSNIDALEVAVLTHIQTSFAWEKAQLESL